jgi:hypothetical protein
MTVTFMLKNCEHACAFTVVHFERYEKKDEYDKYQLRSEVFTAVKNKIRILL